MGNSACRECSYADQSSLFRKTCVNKGEQAGDQKEDKQVNVQHINISDINGHTSTEKQLTKDISKTKFNKFGSSNAKQLSMLDKGVEDTDNSFLPLQSKMDDQTIHKKISNEYDSFQNNPQRISKISGPIPVPFSVIRLLIKKQISNQLINYDKQFYSQLQDCNSEVYRTWKMQKQGYYTNKKSDGTSIIITDNSFYKGWTRTSTFIPEDAGILVTLTGIYDGNFRNGKAHGKGTFLKVDEKTKYIGTWENGKFIKGKIQAPNYRYDGPLKNGTPHGSGLLSFYINKNQYKYIGDFQNGKFQGKGQYQSPDHIYIGNFKSGKKQGEGNLQKLNSEKMTKSKGLQNKQKSVKFRGVWKQDRLQTIKDNE